MISEKDFVNEFSNWIETYFEIVKAIGVELTKAEPRGIIGKRYFEQGTGGMNELAEELTDEFERKYIGVEWG